MKVAYGFPEAVKEVTLISGETVKVYDYAIPPGYTGFLYLFESAMVEGGYGVLKVDGEVVNDPGVVGDNVDGKITRSIVLRINPPVVIEKKICYEIYSPVDASVMIALEGEIYEQTIKPSAHPQPVYIAVKHQYKAVPVDDEKGVKVRVTDTYEQRNVTLRGSTRFWGWNGIGEVSEFWLRANSTDFLLMIEVDGKYPYYGEYSYYADRSEDSDAISAETRNGEYIIHIQEISFKNHINIVLNPSSPVRFSNIYVKYEVET